MLRHIFYILSYVISIYTFLCFIRIILTWIPGLSYSKFTRFMAAICDPYLNLFKGIRWLIIGSFDFSSALGLCVLGIMSTIFSRFSRMGMFSISSLVGLIIELAGSLLFTILNFLLFIFIVRLIIILIHKNEYNPQSPILQQLDYTLMPLAHNIAKMFTGKKRTSYRNELIISSITIFVIEIICSIVLSNIINLIRIIPV